MPRFDQTTGAVSLLRRDWYDVGRSLGQDGCPGGVCAMTLSDGTILQTPCNADAGETAANAGLGVWLREQDATVYTSDGRSAPGATVVRGGVGPDATFALKRARDSFGPWDLIDCHGVVLATIAADVRSIQPIGGGAAVYTVNGSYAIAATPGTPVTLPPELAYDVRATNCPPLNRWILVYQRTADGALVVDGHQVAPPGSYYYVDIWFDGTLIHVVYASSQADADAILLGPWTLDQLAALPVSPPPTPPLVQPVFRFDHPVIVAPFNADGSGLPDLMSFQTGGRHITIHDGYDDWIPPPGLPPWELVMRELYLNAGETIAQCQTRCLHQVGLILANWSGDVGVIPMFYDQLRWTEQQMLDTIGILNPVLSLSPRIKMIAPFAYQRANGIIKYSSLQTCLANLVAERDRVGVASLTPIPSSPTLEPQPMQAFNGFAKVVSLHGGPYYTGVDPSSHGPTNVYFNRPNQPNQGGPWEEIAFTPHSDGGWDAQYVASGVQLSIQDDGTLQSRPSGTYGPFENLQIRTESGTGRLLVYRTMGGGSILLVEVAV